MKKVLFIILFCGLFGGFDALAKEEYDAKQTKTCQDGLLCDLNGKLITGTVKEYDEKENLKSEISYFNGRMNGSAETYYANGNMKTSAHYVYGKKVGKNKKYYENGQLKADLTYKNGEKNGTSQVYDEAGNLTAEILFKNGKAISGEMYDDEGNKTKMTSAHLHNIDKGIMPNGK
ncbi:MAG: hypothetical protein J6P93_03795 [Alphaproteobacteria bacterium]|nr:hypothetical protein [Alphaproteobacteria bacterium]